MVAQTLIPFHIDEHDVARLVDEWIDAPDSLDSAFMMIRGVLPADGYMAYCDDYLSAAVVMQFCSVAGHAAIVQNLDVKSEYHGMFAVVTEYLPS